MITREVQIPHSKFRLIETTVERICQESGLVLKVKSSLKEYPGSVHWHFKKERETGTLEITLWKKERRLWFSVHTNRKGEWIEDMIRDLKSELEGERKSTYS